MNQRFEDLLGTVSAAIENTFDGGNVEYVSRLLEVAPNEAQAIIEAEHMNFAEAIEQRGAEMAFTILVLHAMTIGVMAERLRAAEVQS